MNHNRKRVETPQGSEQNGIPDKGVTLLRRSLLDGSLPVSDAAIVQELLHRLNHSLLACCAKLLTNGYSVGTVEPQDIAQATWTKVLPYLRKQTGSPVETELHLWRLLRVVAQQVYLDLLDREAKSPLVERNSLIETGDGEYGQQAPNGNWEESLPDAIRFAGDGLYSGLIEMLFLDEDAFRTRTHGKARRRLELYKAYVVCQMIVFLRFEAYSEKDGIPSLDAGFARAMDEYREMLGVPDEIWLPLETAVRQPQAGRSDAEVVADLMRQVQDIWRVRLDTGNMMSVLRYELKACAQA